jgi:hypothetical protein
MELAAKSYGDRKMEAWLETNRRAAEIRRQREADKKKATWRDLFSW